jgi:hypothetical protein
VGLILVRNFEWLGCEGSAGVGFPCRLSNSCRPTADGLARCTSVSSQLKDLLIEDEAFEMVATLGLEDGELLLRTSLRMDEGSRNCRL